MKTLEVLIQAASHEAVLVFLLKRWESNRRFFQQHRPDLARLFSVPTRRYELSFDATGLNIRHKSSGTMVYPVHQGRSQLIDTARALAHAPLKSPHYQTIATQGPLKQQDETAYFITAKGINQIVKTAQTLGYKPGTLFADRGQTLPPLVFYGLLSGLHLQLLFEAGVHPGGALIIEPEPEFFLLSAYFVDYGALKEWDLHLAIGAPPTPAQAASFFAARLITRSFLHLSHQSYEDDHFLAAKATVEAAAKSVLRGWGSLEDEQTGLINKMHNRTKSYRLLNQETSIKRPICVVGSGPSLQKLLPFLHANRAGLVLFSAGTALKPLRTAGITPDFQIEIERADHVAGVLREAPIESIPLIAADLVHPTTLEAAQEALLFVRDYTASAALYASDFILAESNPLVGNAALALALNFSNEIYLAGLDAGFRPGERQHTPDSFYDDREDEGIGGTMIAGNFGGTLHTNGLLNKSRLALERAIAAAPQSRVYNLSDGAHIQNAAPLDPKKWRIPARDRRKAIEQIKAAFRTSGNQKAPVAIDMAAYRQALLKPLPKGAPQSYRALRDRLDRLHQESLKLQSTLPVAALLVRGSLWHLLATTHKAALQSPPEAIEALYEAMLRALKECLTLAGQIAHPEPRP